MTLRSLAPSSAILAACALIAAPAIAEEEAVLNVYNWSDYIGETTIADFEAETGIDVNYDVFDSNEVLEAKLIAGNSGYDVVTPTSGFLARQIAAGVFQPLNKDALPNLANMDSGLMERLSGHDPDNAHAIIYLWGTTGIGYNKAMIEERLGADGPLNSWDLVFDPEVAAKLADCGVAMLDASTEIMPAALNYLGMDPTTTNARDLRPAQELLEGVRPHVRYFHSSQYINDLANGEICMAVGWSGDVLQARDRAAEADNGVEVVYTIPKEGAMLWIDTMAIPADAPHVENAHKFLNYLMRPQVAADASNYVFYANGNAASTELVDADVTGDPGIYPTEEAKANLFPVQVYGTRFTRAMTRAWTAIKTGR